MRRFSETRLPLESEPPGWDRRFANCLRATGEPDAKARTENAGTDGCRAGERVRRLAARGRRSGCDSDGGSPQFEWYSEEPGWGIAPAWLLGLQWHGALVLALSDGRDDAVRVHLQAKRAVRVGVEDSKPDGLRSLFSQNALRS